MAATKLTEQQIIDQLSEVNDTLAQDKQWVIN